MKGFVFVVLELDPSAIVLSGHNWGFHDGFGFEFSLDRGSIESRIFFAVLPGIISGVS